MTRVDDGVAEELVLVVLVDVDVGFVEDEEDLSVLELDELLRPQVPPIGLQPVPQYAEVLPHHPAPEQHEPNVDPIQVIVVPQVPSVLIAWDAEEVELVFEDVVEEDVDFVEEVVALDEVEEELELELDELPQVPPTGLQPAPQYAEVLPHHPAPEQHEPNVDPIHVIVVPQVPSVLTA
jgi:hypothetical protein